MRTKDTDKTWVYMESYFMKALLQQVKDRELCTLCGTISGPHKKE
jgi:hypothetical protein